MEHFLGSLDGRAGLVFQPYMHRPLWITSFPEPLPLLPHCLDGSPGTSASLVWTTVFSTLLQAILATCENCLDLARVLHCITKVYAHGMNSPLAHLDQAPHVYLGPVGASWRDLAPSFLPQQAQALSPAGCCVT